jgi:retron-type reverse transcriptase
MLAGVAQGALVSLELFSLYVNDMPVPNHHHVELTLYADDTAITVTSRKSALLIRYLETYLNDLERRLREWRIAINVS